MKKWYQHIRPWFVKYTELPSDIIMELPKITIIGQVHIYIENHQGLITFTNKELKLNNHNGYIQILGSEFVIKMMYPKEILLEGTIEEVKFLPH